MVQNEYKSKPAANKPSVNTLVVISDVCPGCGERVSFSVEKQRLRDDVEKGERDFAHVNCPQVKDGVYFWKRQLTKKQIENMKRYFAEGLL
jgi:hypothetical protein